MPSPVTLEILKNGQAALARQLFERRDALGILSGIDLGRDHDHRLVRQIFGEAGELAHHDFEIVHRIAAGGFGYIHQVGQQARALDVAQELDAQAVAGMRALDQSRNIGDDERPVIAVVGGDDAQVRLERGEGVIGDLGPRGRDARNQRGLAGVRETDQSDIGQQLQLEAELVFFAGTAVLVLGGRLMRRRGEARVALAAAAAACDDETIAGLR